MWSRSKDDYEINPSAEFGQLGCTGFLMCFQSVAWMTHDRDVALILKAMGQTANWVPWSTVWGNMFFFLFFFKKQFIVKQLDLNVNFEIIIVL